MYNVDCTISHHLIINRVTSSFTFSLYAQEVIGFYQDFLRELIVEQINLCEL